RRHRVGADVLKVPGLIANPVEKEEAHPLFHPDAPRADAPILEDLGDQPVRAFVLFPRPDVRAEADQFTRAHLLELGADPGQLAARRDDQREHTFTLAPSRRAGMPDPTYLPSCPTGPPGKKKRPAQIRG